MWSPLLLLLVPLAACGGAGDSFAPHKELLGCASQMLYMDQPAYEIIPTNYTRHIPPGKSVNNYTAVQIGMRVNRVSGVDENKEEITLDVFLQVSWEDQRLRPPPMRDTFHMDLPWEFRQFIWTPDLYISQLQTMRILSVLQEMASLRLYSNKTVSVSIGATITIKCTMDFVLYPLDVQKCDIDFSSYKHTLEDVRFEWRDVTTWFSAAGHNSNSNTFRLPKYVVTFITDKSNHSAARLQMILSRKLRSYILESYLPSSLFVVISWGSFCVVPEIVPGRMVLLVTTLLSLVTMFDTVSTNSPDALELKCIEVWLIFCTFFVFLALMEYFVVLFGIRYDKNWCVRRQEMRRAASSAQLAPTLHINHTQRLSTTTLGGTPQGGVFTPQITTDDGEGFKQQFSHQTIQRDSPMLEVQQGGDPNNHSLFYRISMFCGATHGKLDKYALIVFPIFFTLFTIIYWIIYIVEASIAQNQDDN